MTHLHLLVAVIVASFASFVTSGTPSVQARTLQPASTCTVTTLAGSYEFISSPTVIISQGTAISVPDSIFALSPVPYTAKGTITFDGTGQVWVEAVGQGHEPMATAIEFGAILAVNRCALMVEFANGSELGVRIVDTDTARFPVSTTPGFVILRTP